MRGSFGVVVLLVACGLFALALAIGVVIFRLGFESTPAMIAAALLVVATGGLFASARLLKWRPMVFGAAAAVLVIAATAIAIPNAMNAAGGRSTQKRTMADIRTVATAAEAFATDFNRYPVAGNLDELAPQLEPTYLKRIPRRDAWKNDLRYEAIITDGRADGYYIASAGKDGKWQHARLSDYRAGATTSFAADIIFSNGEFIQYPEGPQSQ